MGDILGNRLIIKAIIFKNVILPESNLVLPEI
jgi:hypothetical protein